MAKLKSLIKIEGTLDGMTFYKGKNGYLVRTKGGVSKSRIENDPAYARTRENGSEFGHIAKSGKLLRQALTSLLVDVKDGNITPRLMKLLAQIKNYDTTSLRGNRQVSVGLSTTEGKMVLKRFDFNSNAKLSSVVLSEYQLNTTTGEISIANLIPLQQLSLPGGATHFGITAAVLNLNFETGEKELTISSELNTPINNTAVPIHVASSTVATGSGNTLFLFKMSFYQEINGIQYALNNGAYNVLNILDIL
ncbi:hypothetical protein EV196_106213 [Mariniflexile fucanivorans]|uniref:Uncharacterized protein n=1 Tax=Mariniflexile fucanivorans TaxID=264023 RepID=A0A4R1RHF6_9FLAO|nr:hypothetical protein [Mariniflexile fucanivorans]TCL65022.1 hypothetical protein EV196_106213 [Mariniflexile fucanivorans]